MNITISSINIYYAAYRLKKIEIFIIFMKNLKYQAYKNIKFKLILKIFYQKGI